MLYISSKGEFLTVSSLLFINLKKNTAVILHILYSVSDDSDKLGVFYPTK